MSNVLTPEALPLLILGGILTFKVAEKLGDLLKRLRLLDSLKLVATISLIVVMFLILGLVSVRFLKVATEEANDKRERPEVQQSLVPTPTPTPVATPITRSSARPPKPPKPQANCLPSQMPCSREQAPATTPSPNTAPAPAPTPAAIVSKPVLIESPSPPPSPVTTEYKYESDCVDPRPGIAAVRRGMDSESVTPSGEFAAAV